MSRPDASAPYAAFLPAKYRSRLGEPPEHSHWQWRKHQIHLLRRPSKHAGVRLIVIHGAGVHASALWPFAAVLPRDTFDIAALDLPLYGQTQTHSPATVRYQDWLDLLCDFVEAEDDGRPLILLGASIGGMIAYEVAERSGLVTEVAATCLLDPRDKQVRAVLTRFGRLGLLAGALASTVRGPLARQPISMSAVAAMSKMSPDPRLGALCASDRQGGGGKVPLGFLASFITHRHTPPERATTPLTLLHPGADAWTPVEVSMPWFTRIAAPTRLVLLPEAGHFPIEEPGLESMLETLTTMAESINAAEAS